MEEEEEAGRREKKGGEIDPRHFGRRQQLKAKDYRERFHVKISMGSLEHFEISI
jgi:hypothetical protein